MQRQGCVTGVVHCEEILDLQYRQNSTMVLSSSLLLFAVCQCIFCEKSFYIYYKTVPDPLLLKLRDLWEIYRRHMRLLTLGYGH